MQARVQMATAVATLGIDTLLAATILPAIGPPLAQALGVQAALVILGVVAWLLFVGGVLAIALVPPFLLSQRDRAAFAAHAWIGAREIRRTIGRAPQAIGLPHDADSANRWLSRTPATDRNRPIRVDALVLAGRYDEARREAALLPERTPLDRYRKLEAEALVAEQSGGEVDEAALREAVQSVPRGIERTEAAASLAVFQARRALPDGDWRAPLVGVRGAIPGSDARLLIVDFGLPTAEILLRKVVVPATALVALVSIAGGFVPALGR
jgi:hypothetical protein